MLYYIEAKVKIKVAGISGPWEKTPVWLVHAPNIDTAKLKYETKVKQDHIHMGAESFHFEYLKIAGEIF